MELVQPIRSPLEHWIDETVETARSANTRRAYRTALRSFRSWSEGCHFDHVTVGEYVSQLLEDGLKPATVNLKLSAIKAMALTMRRGGALTLDEWQNIYEVRGVEANGGTVGNWLSLEDAQALLDRPDGSTIVGKRDRALFALLLCCGLRRFEAAGLNTSQIQHRRGRMVLIGVVGKRRRVRDVPISAPALARLKAYTDETGPSGPLLRSYNRAGNPGVDRLTEVAIGKICEGYGVRAHVLRRTFAEFCAKASGGDLTQTKKLLGHSSVQTTERYLGNRLELEDSPVDHIGLI